MPPGPWPSGNDKLPVTKLAACQKHVTSQVSDDMLAVTGHSLSRDSQHVVSHVVNHATASSALALKETSRNRTRW